MFAALIPTALSRFIPRGSRYLRFKSFLEKNQMMDEKLVEEEKEIWKILQSLERRRFFYYTAQLILYLLLFSSVAVALLSALEITQILAKIISNASALIGTTILLLLLVMVHYTLWLIDIDQQFYMTMLISKLTQRRK